MPASPACLIVVNDLEVAVTVPNDPEAFVSDWLDGWNEHDVERVLAHFSEDVIFSSPVARLMLPESGGVIRGKAQLRTYWSKGLEMIPDLRFEVVSYSLGVDAMVITYRNHRGDLVNEVLVFHGEGGGSLVTAGYGTY